MMKNYFTDEQFKDIANKADLPFEHLPDYYLQKLKDAMNLAVETAIGEPYLHVDYSKMQNVNWIKVNNLKDNTPLYSVKELEN